MRQELKKIKKVVIKIGSNVLAKDGHINSAYIRMLAKEISLLKKEKHIDIVIVSSGAIGLGSEALGFKKKSKTLPEKQAAAAIGQSKLMHIYDKAFNKQGFVTAQVLVTQEDFRDRVRYINVKNTMNVLLKENVIPIVNENDTVSVDEIKFGDNDILSAHITNIIEAELLIILTSVDGLIDFLNNEIVKEVIGIDKKIESLINKEKTQMGTGGMQTKLNAGKIVNKSGEWLVIANGNTKNIITKILDGREIGTVFKPSSKKLTGKKRWIAFNQKPKGIIIIDKGAENAVLNKGKSLLPIGILDSRGSFKKADLVKIECLSKEIGCGIINYSKQDIEKIKGLKTKDIAEMLGNGFYEEAVHRDNLVI